jgi:hypothetical protein
MKLMKLTLALSLIGAFGMLLYMMIDGAFSLSDSRSQNDVLQAKCVLLARLADDGLRGRAVDTVIGSAGADVTAKTEGAELRLDDVVLRIDGGRVTGIDVAETCQ